MAKGLDRAHFDDYRAQTRIKHKILAAYLKPWFGILKKQSGNLNYIDGFAGPGRYRRKRDGKVFAGSPIRALRLIAAQSCAGQVSTTFIESDNVLFEKLARRIQRFYDANPQTRKPVCMHGSFANQVEELLRLVGGGLAPTFLFVDPCRVEGTSMTAIKRVLACDKSEAFIFFNITGVNRIAGLDRQSPILTELLGSKVRADSLYAALRSGTLRQTREELILSAYRDALRGEAGAPFTPAFRIESETRRATSHYLIHASKHSLAFRIMKDVMWSYGRSEFGEGGLEFAQKSHERSIPMFALPDSPIESIRTELAKGDRCVDLFLDVWPIRSADMVARNAYRAAIFKLEDEQVIEVFDKDGCTARPAAKRMRAGEPTLGKGLMLKMKPAGSRIGFFG